MYNTRQSFITESATFVDEFENTSATATMERTAEVLNTVSAEEKEFNSRIRGNFDRIINYNTYAAVNQEPVFNGYADDKPSATTMQFVNEPVSEIYKDYRVNESDYATQTKVRGGAKALIMAFAFIIIALSVLIVFNTALLNNMNGLIAQKTAQVEALKEEVALKEIELEAVSSNEVVTEKAKEYGMVEGE